MPPLIFSVVVPAGSREKRCRPVVVGTSVPVHFADQTAGRSEAGAVVKSTVASVVVTIGVPVPSAPAKYLAVRPALPLPSRSTLDGTTARGRSPVVPWE